MFFLRPVRPYSASRSHLKSFVVSFQGVMLITFSLYWSRSLLDNRFRHNIPLNINYFPLWGFVFRSFLLGCTMCPSPCSDVATGVFHVVTAGFLVILLVLIGSLNYDKTLSFTSLSVLRLYYPRKLLRFFLNQSDMASGG